MLASELQVGETIDWAFRALTITAIHPGRYTRRKGVLGQWLKIDGTLADGTLMEGLTYHTDENVYLLGGVFS